MPRALLLLLALAGLAFPAQAQLPISESFRDAEAAGWVLAGDAVLTSGTTDAPGAGWLRLTSNEEYQRGYAFLDAAFPSTEGVVVDIEFAVWGDTFPGDGFVLFLFDGTIGADAFAIGDWGGSLGYANGCTIDGAPRPGLSGAYVGIGFDEFGNFANPADRCKNGGPGRTTNALTVRGAANAGDADAANDYAFVATTGPLDAPLGFRHAARPDQDGPEYRRAQVAIIPNGVGYAITVNLQVGRDAPFTDVIVPVQFDVPPPPTLKLGFGASTGSARSYHEVRTVVVGDATALPSAVTDLRARTIDRDVLLSWATPSVSFDAGFYVEMWAPGASGFETVGFVHGAGNDAAPTRYTYLLEDLAPGAYRFRLRQVSPTGETSYSDEAEAYVAPRAGATQPRPFVRAYPNPFVGAAQVEVGLAEPQRVEVVVSDLLGRRVDVLYRGEASAEQTLRLRLDGGGLPPGLYLVRVLGERFEAVRRLVHAG